MLAFFPLQMGSRVTLAQSSGAVELVDYMVSPKVFKDLGVPQTWLSFLEDLGTLQLSLEVR